MSTQTSSTTVIEGSKTISDPTPGNSKKENLAEKEKPIFFAVNHKTFFPFNVVGLSAPPIPLLIIVGLLWKYREIPFWDSVFSIAFPVYLCLANRFRFDNNSAQIALYKEQGKSFPEQPEWMSIGKESWFPVYMTFAVGLGVILPLLVQVLAPRPIADATAVHLFILLSQVSMEMMCNGPWFHPMLQMVNSIGFQCYGIVSIKTWLVVSWQMLSASTNPDGALLTWEMFHFLLALGNAAFWPYNLFSTLLLRILPDAFDPNQFPDTSVSWKYQIVPVLNREDTQAKVKTN